MEILSCGHAENPALVRLCAHLMGAKEVDYARCLRGVGVQFDCACESCADLFKNGEVVAFAPVCQACYEVFDDDAFDFVWLGEAQVIESLVPFNESLEERDLPLSEAVFGVAGDGRVFGVANGKLLEIEAKVRSLMRLQLPIETGSRPKPVMPRLVMSKSGRFAALVNDYGRFGVVADLQRRAITISLDRGEYHPEQTPFPLAFFQHQGRDLVVYGTKWNRLDIADPQNGKVLSARESPKYEEKVRPAHYLDYFHGRLHVSPGGEWISDDGWVWAPMGMPVWWSLKDWVNSNVWESEDGPSRVDAGCVDDWNVPMCWIGDERVAIFGIGTSTGSIIDGARIFSVEGEEISAFAGPKGEFFSDGTRLFSGGYNGIQIWDVGTGARTGEIKGFFPQFQIEGALVEIKNQKLRRWNYGS